MGLEAANYINGLVSSNPTSGDPRSQGDDHLRLIKAVLKATFPNLSGAVSVSHTEINRLAGVTSPVLHVGSLAALPAAIGTTTPVAGTFTSLLATSQLSLAGIPVVTATRNVLTSGGLSGGGSLGTDRTLSLDTANTRNVDHAAVSVTGSGGITGGGSLEVSRALSLDSAHVRNVDHSAVTITGSNGISGGGDLSASRVIALDTSSARNVDHSAVSVIAGTGLTGGGTIDATRTLTVDFASEAEAQAGTAADKVISPLSARQAIQAAPNQVKAWARFDGSPVSLTSNYNVSSITDFGVGDFRVNFTTALASTNYAAVANYTQSNTATPLENDGQAACWSFLTTSVRVFVANGAGSALDPEHCSVVVIA